MVGSLNINEVEKYWVRITMRPKLNCVEPLGNYQSQPREIITFLGYLNDKILGLNSTTLALCARRLTLIIETKFQIVRRLQ